MKKTGKSCGICRGMAVLLLLFLLTGCQGRNAEFLKGELLTAGETDRNEELPEETTAEIIPEEKGQEEIQVTILPPSEEPEIYVDVCGAVEVPGVYRLKAGSRVFQAVEASGGMRSDAAGHYVNGAGVLSDGQQIYIPTKEEMENQPLPSGREEAREEVPAENAAEQKINLNTAGEEELTALPGIGVSKARAILAYRQENGGFSSVEEIRNVPGIKDGTFNKIKDYISAE